LESRQLFRCGGGEDGMLSKKEKLARLKIMRCGAIGPTTFWNLIKMYGNGERALKAMPTLYKTSGGFDYGAKSSENTFEMCSDEQIEKEFATLKSIGARIVFFEDDLYPPLLRNIPDPPPLLTMLGNRETVLDLHKKSIISVVGSRNSSIPANKFCRSICQELSSKGVVLVSGLARGIDTSAHLGSLENGTIAILAGGINVVYPQENLGLYNEIAKKGCIFSEMPYSTAPQPHFFPRRNRIIAGLSLGTLVVEAAEHSGSLITARMALEYDRDVFAVPGFPLDPRSVGCNTLLKDGAILVQNADDVLEHIANRCIVGPHHREERGPFRAAFSEQDLEQTRKKILDSLSTVPITIDELISCIRASPHEVLAALLELELSNKIVRLHGQRVCLALGK
jgi:DNA processing protein